MKEVRLYGLFELQNGKWVRVHPNLSFKKSVAVRVFQNALLEPFLSGGPERKIKVVREVRV